MNASVYRSIYFNSLLNNLSLHDYTVWYILSTYLKSEQASEMAKWLCQLKIYLTLGHSLDVSLQYLAHKMKMIVERVS